MAESPFAIPQTKDAVPSEAPHASRPVKSRWQRRWWIGLCAFAVVFLAGFLPMWLKAGRHAGQRETAQRDIRLLKMETLVASAALEARRGEYESARQSASHVFTALRVELDRGPQSALVPAPQEPLKALLARRDNLITLLARSDPASAGRLTDRYLAWRKGLPGAEPADQGVVPRRGP